jgi:hypothetical protein
MDATPPGASCAMNSECQQGLTCSFGRCQSACKEQRDCPTGQQCVRSGAGVNSCLLPAAEVCHYSSECQLPLVCAADFKCRNQCLADRDCATATQKCVQPDGVCAEPDAIAANGSLQNAATKADAAAPQSANAPDAPPPPTDLPPTPADAPATQGDLPVVILVPDAATLSTDAAPMGATTILDIVPRDNMVGGWTVDPANPVTAGRVAATATTLSETESLIDGASAGFFAAPYTPIVFAWQNYVSMAVTDAPAPSGANLSLYILQMPSVAQASGLYASMLTGPLYSRSTWMAPSSTRVGTDSRIADTGDRWWINFYKGNYYVEISLSPSYGPAPDYTPSDPATKAAAFVFATAVAGRIPSGGTVPPGGTGGTAGTGGTTGSGGVGGSAGAGGAGGAGGSADPGSTSAQGATVVATVSSVNVGQVDVGKTSAPVAVVLTNVGKGTASLTILPVGSGIAVTGCSGTLAAGGSCTLVITASPTVAGPISGSVSVAVASGNTLSIAVSGTATIPGSFVLSPQAIDLGTLAVGQTIQASVTVTATSALTGLSASVSGAELRLDATSTCTSVLAAGASCSVVFNFSSAVAGSSTGDAVVVTQGGVTKVVPVTAMVVTPAKLALTPTTAAFAAALGGTSSPVDINVANIGGMASGPLGVVLGGANAADFKITSNTCGAVMLASASYCSVTVVYAPAASASTTATATLTVTDTGVGASTAFAALTGTPYAP